MNEPIKKPQLRTIQYFFVDGTTEFSLGLMCLILAIYFYVETHVEGLLSAIVDVSLVLVIIGGSWLVRRFVKKWKERVTYPRTGYVAYRREQGPKRGWRIATKLILGGLVGALGAILVTSPHPNVDVIPVLTGMIMGIVLGFIGFRTALPRFYILAGLSMATGIALAYYNWPDYHSGVAAYYLTTSLILFASGGLTLWKYLHQNPAVEEQQP